tara:strand:- start:247 stop:702 length:456 start_codon:yes stop_codon:yes gene_type:complete
MLAIKRNYKFLTVLFPLFLLACSSGTSDKGDFEFQGKPVTGESTQLAKDLVREEWCDEMTYFDSNNVEYVEKIAFLSDGSFEIKDIAVTDGRVLSVQRGAWSAGDYSLTISIDKEVTDANAFTKMQEDPAILILRYSDQGSRTREEKHACD